MLDTCRLSAMRRVTIVGMAAIVVASVVAATPVHAQVPGEAQSLSWCAGSKDCLQWTSIPSATQYRVYRGEQSSMPCLVGAPLDSCLESIFAASTTGAGAIPENPAPGRFYWYLVTAQNGTGEGPSGSLKQGAVTQPRVRNTFGSCPVNCTAAGGGCVAASDCCSSDCAGSCQAACCAPAGGLCGQPSDCCSDICVASACQQCLALGQSCTLSATCCTGNCSAGVCVAACEPNGDTCATGSQCCSGTCVTGSCQPSCVPAGGSCSLPGQCCTGACAGGVCVQPTCSDGVKNGSETDVDCGGGTCPPCINGKNCAGGSDCQSQTCVTNVCQCGPPGAFCTTSSQCCGGVCSANACAAVCGDGFVGGTEQCDDGNNVSGDGCSSSCTGEPGYACTGSPSVCTPCPAGFNNCNGSEVDGCEVHVASDSNNCGACNVVCALQNATSSCVAGACTLGACSAGYANCNGLTSDGCEVNVNGDASNCGNCGHVCSTPNATSGCVGGACTVGPCNAGYANCNGLTSDGCEVNVNGDPNNCGNCGRVCSSNNVPSPTCAFGTCNGACATGFLDCNGNKQADGCEVNVLTNPNDCGGCGIACSSNNVPAPSCGGGTCNGACATGFADCNGNKQTDGCEVNLSNNNNNCGTCGHVCPPATICTGGVCFAP